MLVKAASCHRHSLEGRVLVHSIYPQPLIKWAIVTWTNRSGDRLSIKMSSYQYRDPHVKDKDDLATVLSLTWESPYLRKTIFILRRGPLHPHIYSQPLSCWICFWQHQLYFICQYWDGSGSWNSYPWKRSTCLSYIVSTVAAVGLATQGARVSAAIVLT